jgi:hypothetical protein
MNTAIHRMTRYLSLPLCTIASAEFVLGMANGLVRYLGRSPVRETFVPGSSAWWQQGVVAALALLAVAVITWRRRRQPAGQRGGPLLLAPLSRRAARRVAATFRLAAREPGAAGRLLLALPLAALFYYGFYRAGLQVTGGLDPNFTVNAWGGPSYAGAMACHYLDLLVLMAAAAGLLDKLLAPGPDGSRAPGGRSAGHPPADARSAGHRSAGGGLAAGRGHGRLAQADAAVIAGHPVMDQDPEAPACQPGDDPVGQQQVLEHPAGQRHH